MPDVPIVPNAFALPDATVQGLRAAFGALTATPERGFILNCIGLEPLPGRRYAGCCWRRCQTTTYTAHACGLARNHRRKVAARWRQARGYARLRRLPFR